MTWRSRRAEEIHLTTNQYHEPADELPQEIRTFARMVTSLGEECEAIGWYEQRMVLEKNKSAGDIVKAGKKAEKVAD
jgi:hypothetical protein